ncbi:MAG: Fur family transcriptional regulator [Candidatus Aminicenantia bacterium]
MFQRLQSKGVKVSRATLYRTLSFLVRGGVLKTVSLGEDHSHFELGFSEEMYGHFICIECKNVKEFNSEKIKEILEKLSKKTEFSIKSIEIQLFGICKVHKK